MRYCCLPQSKIHSALCNGDISGAWPVVGVGGPGGGGWTWQTLSAATIGWPCCLSG